MHRSPAFTWVNLLRLKWVNFIGFYTYLVITDLIGKEIYRTSLMENKILLNIQLNSQLSGVYLATLYNNGINIETIKLILY